MQNAPADSFRRVMGLDNNGVPSQNQMVHIMDPNQNLMEIGKNENLLDLDFNSADVQ